ncbi:hypothetical protein L6258_01990 [Candidatus Parcubacteria bacterium]|nr:hypothetical protein [Candidatus Parcubacteria bacterium]
MESRHQVQLINQALSAAVSSINLARQLLREVEAAERVPSRDLPGIEGKFDGEAMVTNEGEKYPVSENYASKSLLVVGDTLKMVTEGDRRLFKQIERVRRIRVEGILTKKEGRWHAVTADGSYRILPAAVSFHRGDEGSEVVVLLPQDNKRVGFAALERALKESEEKAVPKEVAAVKKEAKKAEKKPVAKSKTMAAKEPTKVGRATTKKTSEVSKSKQIPVEGDLR